MKGTTMPTMIFVNHPVVDLERTKTFFTGLGYTYNPQFTDEKAGCLVISDTIYVMQLTEPFFQTFTPKAICDASQATETIISLSADSRAVVDDMLTKALAGGAIEPKEAQDLGFMYSRGFQDLNGHLWEYFYMDPAHIEKS
jgi:uncharacterized protein